MAADKSIKKQQPNGQAASAVFQMSFSALTSLRRARRWQRGELKASHLGLSVSVVVKDRMLRLLRSYGLARPNSLPTPFHPRNHFPPTAVLPVALAGCDRLPSFSLRCANPLTPVESVFLNVLKSTDKLENCHGKKRNPQAKIKQHPTPWYILKKKKIRT